jgi:gentisate 1,2-dioxygenase
MEKSMSADHAKRRNDLDARLQNAALEGAWQRDLKKKAQEVHPWLWRWHDIKSNLLEAGELIPLNDVMRMRTIRLVNPSQSIAAGTAKTFGVTIQHLNPGEITESHRHTSASLYFVIEGNGCFTKSYCHLPC